VPLNVAVPNALPPGTPLQNGDFCITGVLGQGGSGITYSGHDARLDRVVAIKEFFPTDSARDGRSVRSGIEAEYSEAKQAFLEEARTLARFQTPNIVDVYAVFEENNTAYMVMEHLHGRSLMQLLQERGPLAESEALKYIEQVASALTLVHNNGLLHQDVKPDNVMVCTGVDTERVVLIDFGLTRRIENGASYSTVRLSGVTRFGTAGYAPLEQYGRQAQVGPFTDVYALGATLYHLLTGEVPTEATDRAAGVQLPDVRGLNPQVSARVADAITAALQMNAASRPQSAREFLDRMSAPPAPASPPAPARYVFDTNDSLAADEESADEEPSPYRLHLQQEDQRIYKLFVIFIGIVFLFLVLDYLRLARPF